MGVEIPPFFKVNCSMEITKSPIKREVRVVGLTQTWKARLLVYLIKRGLMIATIIAISFLIHDGSRVIAQHAIRKADAVYVSVLKELPDSLLPSNKYILAKTLPEIIDQVAKEQKVPAVALAAMVEQESSNGLFLTSQVEERTYQRLVKSHAHLPNEEIKQLARSHGVAHIMGITAMEFCNLHYSELYDNYKNLTCASKYLKMQLDKNKTQPIENRLWIAFKNYNGTGEAAEKHADRVYALMKQKLIDSLATEVS